MKTGEKSQIVSVRSGLRLENLGACWPSAKSLDRKMWVTKPPFPTQNEHEDQSSKPYEEIYH